MKKTFLLRKTFLLLTLLTIICISAVSVNGQAVAVWDFERVVECGGGRLNCVPDFSIAGDDPDDRLVLGSSTDIGDEREPVLVSDNPPSLPGDSSYLFVPLEDGIPNNMQANGPEADFSLRFSGSKTIGAWVKKNLDTGGREGIISNSRFDDGVIGYSLQKRPTSAGGGYACDFRELGGPLNRIEAPSSIVSPDVWTWVACAWDDTAEGVDASMYAGEIPETLVLVASGSFAGADMPAESTPTLVGSAHTTDSGFLGLIDCPQVHSVALSPEELKDTSTCSPDGDGDGDGEEDTGEAKLKKLKEDLEAVSLFLGIRDNNVRVLNSEFNILIGEVTATIVIASASDITGSAFIEFKTFDQRGDEIVTLIENTNKDEVNLKIRWVKNGKNKFKVEVKNTDEKTVKVTQKTSKNEAETKASAKLLGKDSTSAVSSEGIFDFKTANAADYSTADPMANHIFSWNLNEIDIEDFFKSVDTNSGRLKGPSSGRSVEINYEETLKKIEEGATLHPDNIIWESAVGPTRKEILLIRALEKTNPSEPVVKIKTELFKPHSFDIVNTKTGEILYFADFLDEIRFSNENSGQELSQLSDDSSLVGSLKSTIANFEAYALPDDRTLIGEKGYARLIWTGSMVAGELNWNCINNGETESEGRETPEGGRFVIVCPNGGGLLVANVLVHNIDKKEDEPAVGAKVKLTRKDNGQLEGVCTTDNYGKCNIPVFKIDEKYLVEATLPDPETDNEAKTSKPVTKDNFQDKLAGVDLRFNKKTAEGKSEKDTLQGTAKAGQKGPTGNIVASTAGKLQSISELGTLLGLLAIAGVVALAVVGMRE